MPEAKLRSTLAELHQELEQTDSVDAESQRLLREVLADIQTLLESKERSVESDGPLSERLREATREFETSHPRVAETVERVVDALAAMGI